jgi:hypothetical protein
MPADADRQVPSSEASPSLAQILEVIRPQVEKIEEGFTAIRVTLDALASHVGGAPAPLAAARPQRVPVAELLPAAVPASPQAAPAAASPVAVASPLPAAMPVAAAPRAATPAPIARPAVAELPPTVSPASQKRADRPGSIAVSGGDGGNWSRILFGDNLHAGPSISHLSGSLLADVYADDNSAVGLAGQVMTFRTGTAEQKARLLKEVGEAFYGWKPQGDESLLQPLIDWVHAELEAVQLGNRIMVVQVGDRYDMQRHNAKQAGVEVAEVYGWIVLRDNGKVFSKANVAVR